MQVLLLNVYVISCCVILSQRVRLKNIAEKSIYVKFLEDINVFLCGERVPDVIKDLKMRNSSWINPGNPKCYHKDSYKRRTELVWDTQKRRKCIGALELCGLKQPSECGRGRVSGGSRAIQQQGALVCKIGSY